MQDSSIMKDKLFGTDGIRGTPGVYPLTDGMIYKIGNGIAHYLKRPTPNAIRNTQHATRVIIGKDTRLSGHKIEAILADALNQRGIDVILVGIITTPGLSFLTKELKADMGIMISASHNKSTENGIKFFGQQGRKLSSHDEERIENVIFDTLTHNREEHGRVRAGKVRTMKSAQAKYVNFLCSSLTGLNLKGMRIALDCAFGAACPFAKKLFRKLGAKVYAINDTPRGDNINEGGAIDPRFLKALVLKTKADMGVAVDGDGDRGILVDEKGDVLDGDFTLGIISKHLLKQNMLPKNTIVTTVMSNYGLKACLDECGIKMVSTDVGDKFVLEAMLKNNLNLGGEQSGHIIFLDYNSTPDGLLTALQMLKVMKETKCSLNELAKCITKFPQILVNIKVRERKPFEEMAVVNERLRYFNNSLKDSGRILLRYSGTENLARVMVEGKDKDLITNIANSLAAEIHKEIGV